MTKLNHGRSRRRWILTLLFILLATVSMIGPTQAVSGLVAASAAVKEAIASMLGPDAPESAPAAEVNLARSIDELMAPDFTGLIGPASSPAGAPGDVVPLGQSESAASDASSQTGAQSSTVNAGGTGSPGYRGGRPGSRFGSPGFGGMSNGGSSAGSGAFSQEIAETSSASESSESVTDPFSDDGLTSGLVPSIEDDAKAFDPPAIGSGPGSGGGPSPGDVGLPSPNGNQTPQPSVPTFSANPPANGGGPSDPDPVPPSVLEPLLDELDVPPGIAGPNQLRTLPASEPGVFQIPEPSMMALFAIGTAAAVRRRARRRTP